MLSTAFSRSSAVLAALLACLLPVSCGGGGGGGGGGQLDLQTLSGRIDQPGGSGLAGVTVRLGGSETQTDDAGAFIMPMVGLLPLGPNLVEIDGSTATDPGQFPGLEVLVELQAGQPDAVLSQVVTLPNLDVFEAANQSIAVDGSGAVLEAIDLFGPDGDLGLEGPAGTVVTLHGEPVQIGVDFNLTPVPSSEVPMPLPADVVGLDFATVQPGGGAFATPSGGGLDVTLPNSAGLPVGALVDVWSFDHDVGDWVNRSDETGFRGMVVDLGSGDTAIRAEGVITEGGWHAPVLPINVDCATTFTGRVVDGAGNPLSGVSVFTALGQFTMTDSEGRYTMPLVPAYDLNADTCIPASIVLEAEAPVFLGGGASGEVLVAAGSVVPGGVTPVPDIVIEVPVTGCLTGIVNGPTADALQNVQVTGPTTVPVQVLSSGSFFRCGLLPGAYTASYLFEDDTEPTTVDFSIQTNSVTTIVLQAVEGAGEDSVTIQVLRDAPTNYGAPTPVAGAVVLLQGTDTGSANGLIANADAQGRVTFNDVTGPFTVTAVEEVPSLGQYPGQTLRRAVSVIGIDPPNGEIGLLLGLNTIDGPDPPDTAATVIGSVTGAAPGDETEFEVTTREIAEGFPTFGDRGTVTGNGQDSLPVPANLALDALFYLEDPSTTWAVSGLQFLPDVGPIAPGGTATIALDLAGPGYVPFDQSVAGTVPGLLSGVELDLMLELRDRSREIRQLTYLGYFGTSSVPATWPLPDGAAPGFDDFEVVLRAIGYIDNDYDYDLQIASRRLSAGTPEEIELRVDPPPALNFPDLELEVTPQGVYGTVIPGATAPVGAGEFGFDMLIVSSDYSVGETGVVKGLDGGPGSGLAGLEWIIFAPAGATLFIPTAPGIFLPEDSYDCAVQSLRATGLGGEFEFDTLFDADVASNLDDLEGAYETLRVSLRDFGLYVNQP